jgi:hypothetical protein
MYVTQQSETIFPSYFNKYSPYWKLFQIKWQTLHFSQSTQLRTQLYGPRSWENMWYTAWRFTAKESLRRQWLHSTVSCSVNVFPIVTSMNCIHQKRRYVSKFLPEMKCWFLNCRFYTDAVLHFWLATAWMVQGSNPSGGEIFHTCSDRPWGPPSLLYNGWWVPCLFPRSKAAGAWHWPPSPI